MLDRPWTINLSDDARRLVTCALDRFCAVVEREHPRTPLIGKNRRGDLTIPRAVRLGTRVLSARVTEEVVGYSIRSPGGRWTPGGSLEIYDETEMEVGRLGDVARLSRRLRDEIANNDVDLRAAARRAEERVRTIVRGCVDALHAPWSEIVVSVSQTGWHHMAVAFEPSSSLGPIRFQSAAARAPQGSMTKQLAEILTQAAGDGIVVSDTRPSWEVGQPPRIQVSTGYTLRIRNDGLVVEAMRAVRSLPAGVTLVPASFEGSE